MPVLERFSTPGHVGEADGVDRTAWSNAVSEIFGQFTGDFPQFYDPTAADTPDKAVRRPIGWPAFPATLLTKATSQEERWKLADSDRRLQDEYCEWSVERDERDRVTRVTFSSEVPEYWEHVADHDPDRLVELYRTFVDPDVVREQLFNDAGYVRTNPFNASTGGRLAHLTQRSNNLRAAVALAAEATVLRRDSSGPVTHKQTLVVCGELGVETRSSDPSVAVVVNDAARQGHEITLTDPIGLYIDGLTTTGMTTPDRTDPETFWTVERGTVEHAVRASFKVPDHLPYQVGDIKINGREIRFGAQLADRVRVRLDAIVKPAKHTPDEQPCA